MNFDLSTLIIGAIGGIFIYVIAPMINKELAMKKLQQEMFLQKKFEFYEKTYNLLGNITHNANGSDITAYLKNANENLVELFKGYAANSLYLSNNIDICYNKVLTQHKVASDKQSRKEEFEKEINTLIKLAIELRKQIKKEIS